MSRRLWGLDIFPEREKGHTFGLIVEILDNRSPRQRQRAERINERTRKVASEIWEIGREFAEAQQELARHGYGCFQNWVESETPFSVMQAYRFIHVCESFNYNKLLQLNVAASALYLLAAPSTPEEAREEAIERAGNGETITHQTAQEMAQRHRQPELQPAPAPATVFDPEHTPV